MSGLKERELYIHEVYLLSGVLIVAWERISITSGILTTPSAVRFDTCDCGKLTISVFRI